MRLVTYTRGGGERLGATLDSDAVVDLNRACAQQLRDAGNPLAAAAADAAVPASLTALLELGDAGLAAARDAFAYARDLDPAAARRADIRYEPAEIDLLPPIPRPPKIICVARNYSAHAAEAGRELPELPILFARFPQTLVAPGGPIVRPAVSEQLDWEGELALVIGRRAHRVAAADAYGVIAGYTLFNDVTVRDYQFRVTQYTAGKNFDASAPLGPALVLRDAVPDPHALTLTVTVNDEVVQEADTGTMIFSIPTLIEHISEFITLEPGDVIATGTPSGVGFVRKPPRFLRPGDVVRVAIDELGVLENPVVDEAPR